MADVDDKNAIIKPEFSTTMNDRLTAELKLAFPEEETVIERMKSFDYANKTRVIWKFDE